MRRAAPDFTAGLVSIEFASSSWNSPWSTRAYASAVRSVARPRSHEARRRSEEAAEGAGMRGGDGRSAGRAMRIRLHAGVLREPALRALPLRSVARASRREEASVRGGGL